MNPNVLLHEQVKMVTGLAPIVPSSSTPDYVSLKNYAKATIIIMVDNATGVTGSAITVKQDDSVAGSSEKALAFTKVYQNEDTAASDLLVETTVGSNTFTTVTTSNKNLIYIIEIDAADLDVSGGFDCIRAGTANATAAVVSVLYCLWPNRFASKVIDSPSAIID